MSTFNLPDLGEGLQEAEIVAWHVAEGDHVVADQPLLSVETEKAVVEIPSPKAGHIARLLARPGERVKVGAPLVTFSDDEPHADAGTVVGELAEPAQKPVPEGRVAAEQPARAVRASPAVREKARQLGIDISMVQGSGPEGTVTLADVEKAATRAAPHVQLRGARRTMASRMEAAWREVPHATLQDEVEVHNWPEHSDVTVRLIRAVIAGCTCEPWLNASFDGKSAALTLNERIDLGLAIDSPDGLFVPVLRDVARSTPADWRREIDLVERGVAERTLPPDRLRGATFTLSNFGTIAGRHGALIIVPPQVAILGAGRIIERPAIGATGLEKHRWLPLSLTFDHRALTGGQAARFLRAVLDDLAQAN